MIRFCQPSLTILTYQIITCNVYCIILFELKLSIPHPIGVVYCSKIGKYYWVHTGKGLTKKLDMLVSLSIKYYRFFLSVATITAISLENKT